MLGFDYKEGGTMKKLLIVFWLLTLAACTTLPVKPEDEARCGPMPTYAEAQNSVQAYVDGVGLKDPSSAQVRNIRVVGPTSWYNGLINGGGYSYGWQITFDLNAKNSFGAYVGFSTREILRLPDGTVRWRW